ncbi:plasmid stabilization system [Pseudopedobacter saltans DSM 12145]|uniref:Plasmid stabilization system n=1 Tax=Pseudopedobacter saltans (strain ATCC 51119 / DSM 12145 / JCM 21818 / CCUG 39354 / LMG 10337 / NBRC 100064 / NCIMB 13643) TaxID=762903 RepID=F0SD73_PSESL|nr:type II toxin-antitoxin system RelE/ParE family toxin [Pseudopedobacter saltans]ADY52859.1 plasmid stabilization system [Pseudopedobacter saltans DSM 12145]
MAKKLVIWTQTAIKQRREILKYWTSRNKSTTYAEKLIKLIEKRTSVIAKNPESGKTTNHLDTREAAMGNFSIYYRIIDPHIYITSFWDNRQDPEKFIELLIPSINFPVKSPTAVHLASSFVCHLSFVKTMNNDQRISNNKHKNSLYLLKSRNKTLWKL